jgi:hypothetical protein
VLIFTAVNRGTTTISMSYSAPENRAARETAIFTVIVK